MHSDHVLSRHRDSSWEDVSGAIATVATRSVGKVLSSPSKLQLLGFLFISILLIFFWAQTSLDGHRKGKQNAGNLAGNAQNVAAVERE